jgi:hypothetical protein
MWVLQPLEVKFCVLSRMRLVWISRDWLKPPEKSERTGNPSTGLPNLTF